MQNLMFLFILLFALLSGAAGAVIALRLSRPGKLCVAVGLVLAAIVFATLLGVQFGLLRLLGDVRPWAEVTKSMALLVASCCIFWVPAFLLTYAAYATTSRKPAPYGN